VPVSNPDGVAPLMAIALAATEPGEPPPRVIALVPRPSGGDRSESAEREGPAPPTPALIAAIEYGRANGAAIETEPLWSDNPAADIISAAESARVAWVLLGYHQSALGGDTMGGVVREVFASARALPINLGVFIHGTNRPVDRVFAAVDAGADGRAVLELAIRIARRDRRKLRALLVPGKIARNEAGLVDLIRDARARLGRLFPADVLTKRSLNQLFSQTPGQLLIVGRSLADELGLRLDEVPTRDRCVIVLQGAHLDSPSGTPHSDRPE